MSSAIKQMLLYTKPSIENIIYNWLSISYLNNNVLLTCYIIYLIQKIEIVLLYNETYFHIQIICKLATCGNVIDRGQTTIDTEDNDSKMYLKCFS
jgi:hypothetical protein